MNKTFAKLLLPIALACAATLSQAAVVSYSFSVSGANVPAGAGGSFSFESTSGQANAFGETEFALLSFSFSFGAQSFDLQGLFQDKGLAIFDGSTLRGLEAVGDGDSFSFLPATANTSAFLVWNNPAAGLTQRSSARTLDLSFAPRNNEVPEPGTAWLVPMLLAAAWALRRRPAIPQAEPATTR